MRAICSQFIVPIFGLALGCASSGPSAAKDPIELDIPTTALNQDPTPNWRQFFKPHPSPSERIQIQRSLDKWVDTGDVSGLLKKARNELAIGKTAQAEVTLREALRRSDNNPETALELAQIYIRKKDSVRAFEILAQIKDMITPSDRDQRALLFRYRYNLALAHLLRKDRERANLILTDLIAIDPLFAPGYSALASSYISIGKFEIGEFVAKRGLDRSREDPAMYNMLGLAAERQSRATEATASYDRALQLNPAHVPTLINRGALAIRNGDCKEGMELMTRALGYAPGESNALVGVGTCQRRGGETAKATASFRKALELDPENAVARFNLALLYSEDSARGGEASRLLREVLQSSEENHEVKKLAAIRLRDLEGTKGDENDSEP